MSGHLPRSHIPAPGDRRRLEAARALRHAANEERRKLITERAVLGAKEHQVTDRSLFGSLRSFDASRGMEQNRTELTPMVSTLFQSERTLSATIGSLA
jgi:hypothetical protein